jgi:DNA-binding MarR family transcriptional regulator
VHERRDDAGHDARAQRERLIRERRQRLMALQIDCMSFLDQIVATARAIEEARDLECQAIASTPAQRALLRALARTRRCMGISDAARVLRISRQAARAVVLSAARSGLVELSTHPEDRRTLLIDLSSVARESLDAVRDDELRWAMEVLHGLDERVMRETERVLDVIRQRLARRVKHFLEASGVKFAAR